MVSLRSSTTRSAIVSSSATRAGTTSGCFSRRDSSTARCMAKIHTVEWSTAIMPEPPASRPGCATNWGGLLGEAAEHLSLSQRQRAARGHSRIADRSPRRAVFADRGVRLRLSHASADARRLRVAFGARPTQSLSDARAAGARPVSAGGKSSSGSISPTSSTRSASRIRARSVCTTTRGISRISCRTTASASISPPSTSCATASAACRVTTSSAAWCTRRQSTTFEELTDNPRWARGDEARLQQRRRAGRL